MPRWILLEVGTEKHYGPWMGALASQIGKPYDFIGILDFVTGSTQDRNWRDESAWFCDELGVWAEERANITPRLPDPVYRLTPGSALMLNLGLPGTKVLAYAG